VNLGLARALVFSLALTLIIECGFFLATGKKNKKDLLLAVLANIITNPVVVLGYWLIYLYTNWSTMLSKAVLELSAVVVEGNYYRKYGQEFTRPFLFSLGANGLSFAVGHLIQRIILEVR